MNQTAMRTFGYLHLNPVAVMRGVVVLSPTQYSVSCNEQLHIVVFIPLSAEDAKDRENERAWKSIRAKHLHSKHGNTAALAAGIRNEERKGGSKQWPGYVNNDWAKDTE